VLLRMDRQIELLAGRVERLEREVAKSSRNSSLPPSSDPPGAGRKRMEGPVRKAQGAQPGHEGRGRGLLPGCSVDEVVEYWPDRCGCGHVFAVGERVAVGEPARWQVEELPAISVTVTEHRANRVCCPACGASRVARLPRQVAVSAFGPRLQATVATLAVRNRVSRRDTIELCGELFGARLSTGGVERILDRTGDALSQPYEGLLAAVRAAGAINMDETGWRLRGSKRTLWGVFTDQLAVFHIAPDRHEDRARELLTGHKGVVTSDRWWAYNHLPLKRRQVCWAHLKRDFTAHAEGSGAERELGEHGLIICEQLFRAWETFQQTGDRDQLKRQTRPLRRELKPILRQYSGKAPRYKRCRGITKNLLKAWPALWTFTTTPGVTPTNNHAERSLRGAVIYRKLSLGSQSQQGEQRTARLLSASITCRLQHQSLHTYTTNLLTAHARGDPTPQLT